MPPTAQNAPSTPPRTPRPRKTSQPAAARGTSYVVLRRVHEGEGARAGDGDRWETIGSTTAANDRAAVKAVVDARAEKGESKDGTFVAVPARSFQPRTRAIKTVEKDEWS